MKNYFLLFLIIISLVIIAFPTHYSLAQLPENSEDIKGMGKRIWESFVSGLKSAWQGALGIWQKMWNWFKSIWEKYIWSRIKYLWERILSFSKGEIETKKPVIEEEFKKEKEEMEIELPKAGKTLWERFKELFR